MEADESIWQILERYRVEAPGRSGGIWVGIDLEASTKENVDDISHLGDFEGRMRILTIRSIRQLEPEALEQLIASFSQLNR